MNIMSPSSILTLALAALPCAPALAQDGVPGNRSRAHAPRAPQGHQMKLDGRVDPDEWAPAGMLGSLTQVRPVEGVVPSHQTQVYFLQDGTTRNTRSRQQHFDGGPIRSRSAPY